MENKTECFRVRATQDEIAVFEKYANKVGETRSRLLRKFIREIINDEPDLLLSEQIVFRQAVSELVRCTRCLNQISTAIKTGQHNEVVLDNQLIQDTLDVVNELKTNLNLYLRRTHMRWVKMLEQDK